MDLDGVSLALRGALPSAAIHRRADLHVSVIGPWRPSDLFQAGPECLVWTATFLTHRPPLLTEEGLGHAGRGGILRRHAPVTPAELVVRASGDGLVLLASDHARLGYAAVYRERRLRWSLLLEDRVRTVRCDGDQVQVEAPPGPIPEADRTGVLLAGLASWLREPIDVDAMDRFTFVERLAELADEPVPLIEDGEWQGSRPVRRSLAAGG